MKIFSIVLYVAISNKAFGRSKSRHGQITLAKHLPNLAKSNQLLGIVRRFIPGRRTTLPNFIDRGETR
jgi:hypothetical protein